MKKALVATLALLAIATTFVACGKEATCYYCGEVKRCKTREVLGQEITYCRDCDKQING